MVGQRTLNPFILVRIQVPEPRKIRYAHRVARRNMINYYKYSIFYFRKFCVVARRPAKQGVLRDIHHTHLCTLCIF